MFESATGTAQNGAPCHCQGAPSVGTVRYYTNHTFAAYSKKRQTLFILICAKRQYSSTLTETTADAAPPYYDSRSVRTLLHTAPSRPPRLPHWRRHLSHLPSSHRMVPSQLRCSFPSDDGSSEGPEKQDRRRYRVETRLEPEQGACEGLVRAGAGVGAQAYA